MALIGNAASAIQLLPEVAERAAHLTVFQRTPNWIVRKPDRAFTAFEKWAFRHVPLYQRLYRLGSFWIHESRWPAFIAGGLSSGFVRWRMKQALQREVADADLRAKLTPDFAPGCKRILLSNDYFQTLARDDVTLNASGVAGLERGAVIDGDGASIPADIVVLATGFQTTQFLSTLDVVGRAGVSLRALWGDAPQAYKGVAVSGFPNLFLLYGPNTNLGHNSIIFMVERQSEYVGRQVARLLKEDLRTLEVRQQAQARFNARIQKDLARTVWAEDCPSWYKTSDGRITNNWSGLASAFALSLTAPDAQAWAAER